MRYRMPNLFSKRVYLLPAAVLVAVIFFVAACSMTARDRVMHFFFEYPAEADASQESLESEGFLTARQVAAGGATAPFAVSRHSPFVERRCAVCHDPQRQFAPRADQSATCQSCHASYFQRVPFGHAPVVTGDCTFCHTMHVSQHESLLKFSQATLCVSCHDAEFEEAALATYHRGIESLKCTACHNPHGSSLRMLLKPEKDRPGVPAGRSERSQDPSGGVD